jgi:hypothetical protein
VIGDGLPYVPRTLDDLGLGVHAFRVYCRIVRRAGDGDGTCFESIPKMAAALGMWRPTVTSAVRELRKRQMIHVKERKGQTGLITLLPVEQWRTGAEDIPGMKAAPVRRQPGSGAENDPATRAENSPQRSTHEGPPLKVAARAVRKRTHGGHGPSDSTRSSAAWSREACADWNARFGPGSAPGGRIAGGLGPVVKANGWPTIRPAWRRYLKFTKHPSPSAQDFAAHWSEWKPEDVPARRAHESTGPVFVGERKIG